MKLFKKYIDQFYFESDRFILKVLDASFAERVLVYKLDNKKFHDEARPQPNENYFTVSYQKSILETEAKLLEQYSFMRLYIFNKKDKSFETILGDINIGDIKLGNVSACTIGIKVHKNHTQKGIAFEALQRAMSFLFDDVGIHKMEANILPRNKSSLKLFKKFGFKEEGIAHDHMYINGVWEDHLRFYRLNK